MAEEYDGMTEEKFDEMYPDATDNASGQDDLDTPPEQGVTTDSPPVEGDDQGQEDDIFDDDDFGTDDEQDDVVDDRGVPWKNQVIELRRKLKNLQDKSQPKPEPQPDQDQVPLPPPLPQIPPYPAQNQQFQPPPQQPPQPQPPPQQPVQQQQAQTQVPQQPPQTVNELLEIVNRQVEQRAQEIIQQRQEQERMAEAEQRLMADYPDLSNQQSPMFRWTSYFLQTRYGGNPLYAEEAAMFAANKIGVVPKSQQQQRQALKPLQREKINSQQSERSAVDTSRKSKIKLPPGSIKFAKRFGQDIKAIEKMAERMNYQLIDGTPMFQEAE